MKEYILRRISGVHVFDANGNELPSDMVDSLGVSLLTGEAVQPPTLGPAIADRTYVVGAAPVTIDLSQRFLGAISYGMTPTNIPGVTRSGAIVTIDPATTRATTAITVSGTNTAGTATMTFNLTVNAVSPTSTAALPDRSLTVGDAAVTLALGDYFVNAASYSVSPTGQGVSISGSTLTISAAAERNGTYTVTASNSTGQTVSDAFALVVAAAVTAPSPFVAGDWTLATGLEANQLVVSVNTLPANGGSPITAIQYSANSGTWTPLGGAGTGARTLTMPAAGTSYSVRLRAVNAAGNSTPSDTKTATSGAADTSAQRVIILTDYAGDCDDAAAMAIAARAHDEGEINLLGVVTTSTVATSAPGVRGQLDAYGLQAIPVYAYQASVGTYNDRYSIQVRDEFGVPGQTRTAYQDDVTGLRTLLAAAPNGSVKLIDIGAPISTARLLASPADGISALTGAELVAAKVAGLWAMAGNFPTGVSEYNMNRDVASSQAVYSNWPTPIYAHGGEVGATIFTGPAPGTLYGDDPVKTAFDAFQNVYGGSLQSGRRQSWDPATVHHAIYGNQALYSLSAAGTIAIDGTGVSTWTAGGGNRQYVIKTGTDAAIAASMQALIDDYAIIAPSPSAAVDAAILALSPLFLLSAPDGATIPDATGNGRSATIIGTNPGTTIGTGPGGMPFFESSTNTYAVLAHDTLYNSAARTMCLWYNTTPSFQSTIGLYRGATERMVVLAPGTTAGAEWNTTNNNLESVGAFNAQGQWTFVAMTVGAGGSFLYTSQGMTGGALRVAASNAVTTGVTTTLRLALGARATSSTAFDRIGRGAYAKVSRWDRALSQAEIQSIYDASIIA